MQGLISFDHVSTIHWVKKSLCIGLLPPNVLLTLKFSFLISIYNFKKIHKKKKKRKLYKYI